MSRIPVVVLLALAVLFARPTAGAESVADLSACEARFATAPEAEDSAKCFYDLGRETEDLAPVRQMRLLLARHPGHPWLSLYLAHLMSREPEPAAPLYRAAPAGRAPPPPPRQTRLLLARHPGPPWLALYPAPLMSREPEQAAPLYRDASAGFALRR